MSRCTSLYGELGSAQIQINQESIESLFRLISAPKAPNCDIGNSIAVMAWPGKKPDGGAVVCDDYQPETVTTLQCLIRRAHDYGCGEALEEKLRWISRCLKNRRTSCIFSVAIILCARRPFHLIGEENDVEILPYIIENIPPSAISLNPSTPVRPAALRHKISPSLLERLTFGKSTPAEAPRWTLLGCGSLGSKIALHLARAGRAPATVIDAGYLGPHNAARHALAPDVNGLSLHWIAPKAHALREAIEGLGQTTAAVTSDIVAIASDAAARRQHLPKGTWALINTTASLVVREALGGESDAHSFPPIIEATLFARGQVGLMTVESGSRNPNTMDLLAEAYTRFAQDEKVRPLIFPEEPAVERQVIGEGCGSTTMVMSDSRLSMLAAPMAEAIMQMQRAPLPSDTGRILVARVGQNGLDLNWASHIVERVYIAQVEQPNDWVVRISDAATKKMDEEVHRWPGVETGGIVMGRLSEAARAFYVTDVLPAPPDSRRSATEFVLGTSGARRAIADYAAAAGYALFCLGTWHNHLADSGPSRLDLQTAGSVALARLAPSILLIKTPSRFRAVLADAASKAL